MNHLTDVEIKIFVFVLWFPRSDSSKSVVIDNCSLSAKASAVRNRKQFDTRPERCSQQALRQLVNQKHDKAAGELRDPRRGVSHVTETSRTQSLLCNVISTGRGKQTLPKLIQN